MKLITDTLPAMNYGEERIQRVLINNAKIDLARGYTLPKRVVEIVERSDLQEDPEKNNLLELGLFLSKRCNAACPNCYCGESRKDGELTREQKEEVILQAKALGAKVVYTAGAGEPTIDKDFLHLAKFIHEQEIEWIVYSNGITFSNDEQALRNVGVSSLELADRLVECGTTIVYKMWSSEAFLNNELTGTRGRYNYRQVLVKARDGSKKIVDVSTGLGLLKEAGMKKLALETLCSSKTFDDVYGLIVPFAEQIEVPIIVEPILLSGGAKDQSGLVLTGTQLEMINPYLTDFGPRNFYSVLVDNRGYMHLSHGEVNLAHPNPAWRIIGENGRVRNLLDAIHSDQVLANNRYKRLPEGIAV